MDGKSRFERGIVKLRGYDLEPKSGSLEIGIAPEKMSGGRIVEKGQTIFVAMSARDDQIERTLLGHLSLKSRLYDISFFSHNKPSIAELMRGKEKVERVVTKFYEKGLNLICSRLAAMKSCHFNS